MGQLSLQSFDMESAIQVTENLRNTMATVKTIETANKEMKKQYGKADIDRIEVNIASLRYGAIPTPYSIIIECPL
jgi:hypothetical protein